MCSDSQRDNIFKRRMVKRFFEYTIFLIYKMSTFPNIVLGNPCEKSEPFMWIMYLVKEIVMFSLNFEYTSSPNNVLLLTLHQLLHIYLIQEAKPKMECMCTLHLNNVFYNCHKNTGAL